MKYPSALYMIISFSIFVILTLILYVYANKLVGTTNLYIISNILLIGLSINFITIFILIITYNRVKFTPGLVGPKGLIGPSGLRGTDAEVEQCEKQNRNIGQNYVENEKKDLIRIQKPVMYDD